MSLKRDAAAFGFTAIPPSALIPAISIVIWAIGILIWPRWTVDDAYISYRYADNLVDHGELNWNPGTDPVEGYTGIVLPLVTAAGRLVGMSPVLTARIMGIASGFLLILLLHLAMLRRTSRGSPARLLLPVLATSPFLYAHSWAGLETLTFSLGIFASALVWIRITEREPESVPRAALLALSFLLLITSLTRPEGVLLAGLTAAGIAWEHRRRPRFLKSWLLLFGCGYILPAVCYFVWRIWYYGHLLPNTFHTKHIEGALLLPGSLRAFQDYLAVYLALPTVALLLMRISIARSGTADARTAGSRPPAWLVVSLAFWLLVVLKYMSTWLMMNYSHRFFIHYQPLLLLCLAFGLNAGRDRVSAAARLPAVLAPLLLWGQVALNVIRWNGEIDYIRNYSYMVEDVHGAAARRLAPMPPDEWIVTLYDAGRIAYETRLPCIDGGALNDEFLARESRSREESAEYVLRNNPGGIVITSLRWDEPEIPLSTLPLVMADPRFGNYELVDRFRTRRTRHKLNYYDFIYIRRDLLHLFPDGGDLP